VRAARHGYGLIGAANEQAAPMRSRTLIIAGAGIGGLTAALALAEAGFRVVVLDQAVRLLETGAGLQLSPNAARVLLGLGLGERLKPFVATPQAIRVMAARSGRELLRITLETAELRYGAPYWVVHRGDLQTVLLAAVADHPDISLELGRKVDDFAIHPNGVTVHAPRRGAAAEEFGTALIGADGLWSSVRARLGEDTPLRFAGCVAWRSTVPAEKVPSEFREPNIHLWLGRDSHLVHYPVRAERAINIVAIARDPWQHPGWSAESEAAEVSARFAAPDWSSRPRELLAVPERWTKWALYDRAPLKRWGRGPVTLLGDAAHPMLPFLAQGAAMAIEDAAVLTSCLGKPPAQLASAMRIYEAQRRPRTAKIQRAARLNASLYHLSGPPALLRDIALAAIGGGTFLLRYDWIYDWKPT
jgi:salicylate hydroxylase